MRTIQDLQTYTDSKIASDRLSKIIRDIEDFDEWYSQFYFDDYVYDNNTREAVKLLSEFADAFEKLAKDAANGRCKQ